MKNINKKIFNIVFSIIIVVLLYNIVTSIYHIYIWKKEGEEINELAEELINTTEIEEIEQEEQEEVVIVEQKEEIKEKDPYWEYINMSIINVDFYDLKEVNSDVVGWITINGTNINYPFVQTNNNEYYLTHAFDKSHNSAGWVFLDYRNSPDLSDKNNIIYAHGRYDKTMFGTLRNALTNGWLNNKNNYVIKISDIYNNSLWQVFSIYHIPVTSDYLKIDFKNEQSFLNFADMLIKRSAYNFNTTIGANDKILTLSTCYNDKERVVLHAKLIKYEQKNKVSN